MLGWYVHQPPLLLTSLRGPSVNSTISSALCAVGRSGVFWSHYKFVPFFHFPFLPQVGIVINCFLNFFVISIFLKLMHY